MFEEQIRKIARRPLDIKLLVFVGRGGVATHAQCIKLLKQEFSFITENDDKFINNYIVDAIDKKHLLQTDTNFDNPSPTVLCLSDEGFRKICNFSEKLGEEMIYGQPNERRISSMRHDLVTTESYLFWNQDHYIGFYQNESILRSQNKKKSWDNKKYGQQNRAAESESLPDYRIALIHRETHKLRFIDCESVIKYKSEKITKKLKGMTWFTDSDYQVGNIEALTGCEVHLVKPLEGRPAPEFDQAVQRALRKSLAYRETYHLLGDQEKTILDTLRETRMTMCVTDVQQFIKAARPALERAVKKLVKTGAVQYRRGKITSEANLNHPNQYYYLPGAAKVLSGDGFKRHLILNAVNGLAFADDWRFYHFDPVKPALTLVKDESLETYLPDYDQFGEPQSLSATVKNYTSFAGSHPYPVKLVVVNRHRYEKLSSALGTYNLTRLTDFNIKEF